MNRALTSLVYIIARGVRGMVQAPLVQVLAMATIAVCMLLLGTVVLVWQNAQSIADRWGVDVPITVYLVDEVEPAAASELASRLATVAGVSSSETIAPELALQRLVEGLGDDPGLLDGVDADVLPTSIEVRLADSSASDDAAVLAAQLRSEPIVEEVVVAGAWAERAEQLLATLRQVAIGAAALVGFACLTIVWSTIRLAVYARRAEIQILRLVGGTAAFVRGPFVVEGLVQGALGATLAVALLWLGFAEVGSLVADAFALAFAAGSLRFLSPPECIVLVGFGAALGVLGSRAAVARYVEA